MLKIEKVHKSYGKKKVLDNVDFQINKGDVLALLGENGAGKSTTIALIATLVKPDQGDIKFENISIVKHPNAIRKKLGYVPQDIALYEGISGLDNLKFWSKAYHLSKQEEIQSIDRVCNIIQLSQEDIKRKVFTYSGGMKRRLNIGVALLHNPQIVLMDEPTVGLDIVSRKAILNTIKELNKAGTTVVYTGHYLNEIEEISNRFIILQDGKVIATTSKQELEEKKVDVEKYYLETLGRYI